MKKVHVFSFALAIQLLAGCAGPSIVGLAAGAGATVGIAAAREGGVSSAAEDLAIRAKVNDKWFKYSVSTFAKLNLSVDQGRVLITGIVQNPDDRVQAVRLACAHRRSRAAHRICGGSKTCRQAIEKLAAVAP